MKHIVRAGLLHPRERILLVVAGVMMIFLILLQSPGRAPLSSSETRFVERSASGMQIVPASCPSAPPHFAGDTGLPNCSAGGGSATGGSGNSSGSEGNGDSDGNDGSAVDGSQSGGAPAISIYLGHNAVVGYIVNTQVVHAGTSQSIPTITMAYGSVADVSWNPYGYSGGSCTVYGGYGIASARDSSSGVGIWGHASQPNWIQNSVGGLGNPLTQNMTFTLACADSNGTVWQTSVAAVVTAQCSLPSICSDDTHVLNQCTSTTINCVTAYGEGWHCASGACHKPEPPKATLTAAPTLVHVDETTKLTWTSQYAKSCFLAGSNGDGGDGVSGWTGLSGTNKESSGLKSQTVFTLTCLGLDGSTITKKAIINIIPVFQET